MSKHPEAWPAGTPCWVDIMVKDLPRSQAFYSDVLRWDYTDSDPEAFGGYCNAHHEGALLAGLSPTMEGMEGAPNVWTVYLATEDIGATQTAAEGAGAQPLAEPMEIAPFGHMAIWLDPNHASFGAWQSLEHTGFGETDVHGAVTWCDLAATDYEAAREFYGKIFGYSYDEMEADGAPYSMFSVAGGEMPAGGIGGLAEGSETPPGWSVTFQVDDTDAAAAAVTAAGGTVTKEPYDFGFGRICMVTGPDGERFGMMTPKNPM